MQWRPRGSQAGVALVHVHWPSHSLWAVRSDVFRNLLRCTDKFRVFRLCAYTSLGTGPTAPMAAPPSGTGTHSTQPPLQHPAGEVQLFAPKKLRKVPRTAGIFSNTSAAGGQGCDVWGRWQAPKSAAQNVNIVSEFSHFCPLLAPAFPTYFLGALTPVLPPTWSGFKKWKSKKKECRKCSRLNDGEEKWLSGKSGVKKRGIYMYEYIYIKVYMHPWEPRPALTTQSIL